MRMRCFPWTLHPRSVFRISRGNRREVINVFLALDDGDGNIGFGEASPNAFYRESAELVIQKLEGCRAFIESLRVESVEDVRRAWHDAWPLVAPSRAAQCALDLALWDLLGRRKGKHVSELALALGRAPKPVASFCTI